jgi:hypothetical protein
LQRSNIRSQLRLNQLRDRGVAILGTVTQKHCENHGELSYAFTVANQKFGGRDTCDTRCSDATIGQSIKIIYAESNPRNSECVSLSARKEAIAANYIGLLIIGCAAGVLIYKLTSPSRGN